MTSEKASFRSGYVFIVLSIFLQALSGVLSKYAALTISDDSLLSVAVNGFYLLSLACLVAQAIVWQQALKRFDLSFAYPFVCLVNAIILVLSFLLFGETITLANVAGVAIATAGIFLLLREGSS